MIAESYKKMFEKSSWLSKKICAVFGHSYKPGLFGDYTLDKTNFICKRCKKRVKNIPD